MILAPHEKREDMKRVNRSIFRIIIDVVQSNLVHQTPQLLLFSGRACAAFDSMTRRMDPSTPGKPGR
jgi:hypothetical protein